jgi:hypothetical protein
MEEHPEVHTKIEGELVAELLDQQEYHSNIENVAVVSSEQLCFLKRVHHEVVPFALEYLDMKDCRAIEYKRDTAYYRIVAAILCFGGAIVLAYLLATDPEPMAVENGPLIIMTIGLVTFGIRFSTSIHRHILRFHMPDQTLIWRSPAIDYKSKAEAAHAVREFARERGLLKSAPA